MAKVLYGAPVIKEQNEKSKIEVLKLKEKGVTPCLAILRIGDRAEDIAYERSSAKRCEELGVDCLTVVMNKNSSQEEVEKEITKLNTDKKVHGILLMRPFPKHLDDNKLRNMIDVDKDVDGCTDISLAGVFSGEKIGFTPCTAHAAMRILNYYGYTPVTEGEQAAVIGRSLVIGRPVSMMLLKDDFTVNLCHSKTANLKDITKRADVIIVAAGKKHLVDDSYVSENQVVIDVGTNWDDEKQAITGDVDFDRVEPIVEAITPVPGGVGTVTTSILARHVIEACARSLE